MSHSTQDAKVFWEQYWIGVYGMPRAWAHKGENLVHAFRILAAQAGNRSISFDIHDQAIMLAGMACEVLLKAIIVHSPQLRTVVTTPRKNLNDAEKLKRDKFYQHELVALAALADVVLSQEQVLTAKILSEFISWRGRYVLPTQANVDDLVPFKMPNGLVGSSQNVISICDAENLTELIVAAVQTRLYMP